MRKKRRAEREQAAQRSVPQRFAAFLDVPLPAVCSIPRIELYGDREFSIEGAAGIIEYDENRICIAAGDKIVQILGSGLNITMLNDKNMAFAGEILSVEFIS